MAQQHIYIDYETYSSVDLKKHGLRRYVASPDFEIILCSVGYYLNGEKVVCCYDLTKGMPNGLKRVLLDNNIIKHAWNAQFERVCTNKLFNCEVAISAWPCIMAHALYCGMPGSLDECGRVLDIENAKLAKEGKNLIRRFCSPRKPTKADPRTRIGADDQQWENFKTYNIIDVKAEMDIAERIECFPMPEREVSLYNLDQRINELGIQVDLDFAKKADQMHELYKRNKKEELKEVSGLPNVSSVTQIKEWMRSQGIEVPTKITKTGEEVETLDKAAVKNLLDTVELPDEIVELLTGRQQLGKSSNAKYQAMIDAASDDSRIRGLFQYSGANRTHRWAGRLVQLHNLPQNHIDNLSYCRAMVSKYPTSYKLIEMLFGDAPTVLSQLIRTAFVAKEGHFFGVADFSAIEARVTAWLANEKWRLDVFKTHGKIYEASVAQMFGVPIESVTKGSDLRQKGKIAELAFGFGGGIGAAKNFGADKMGLSDEQLQELVNEWRRTSPNIVKFWDECYKSAVQALNERSDKPVVSRSGLKFRLEKNSFNQSWLTIELHSGTKLFYFSPHKVPGKFTTESLAYLSADNTKTYVPTQTYGGKLAENVIQATARDLLAEKMLMLDAAGFSICLHVHDEVVCEIATEEEFNKLMDIMKQDVYWAPGLPINADGYTTPYYRKD